jgi:hypothetical protein
MSEESKFTKLVKQRAGQALEKVVAPVAGGVLRMGQGVSGIISKGASAIQDSSTLKASAAKAKPIVEEPPMKWSDIPRKVWETMTEDGNKQYERAVDFSHQHDKQILSAAGSVKKVADAEHDFGRKEGDRVETFLGPKGKLAMKATEAVPQIAMSGPGLGLKAANMLYGAASEIGKEKDTKAAIPTMLAEAAVKGNSKLANAGAAVVEDAIKTVGGYFSKAGKKGVADQ